jgi:hypothetical protein
MKDSVEIHAPEAPAVKPARPSAAAVLARRDFAARSTAPQRVLFSDSLLEFGAYRQRRAFTTFTSFLFTFLLIASLLLLPLYFTKELPKAQLLT